MDDILALLTADEVADAFRFVEVWEILRRVPDSRCLRLGIDRRLTTDDHGQPM